MNLAAVPSTLIHLKPEREVSVSLLHMRNLGLAAQWLTQEESHKGAVRGVRHDIACAEILPPLPPDYCEAGTAGLQGNCKEL